MCMARLGGAKRPPTSTPQKWENMYTERNENCVHIFITLSVISLGKQVQCRATVKFYYFEGRRFLPNASVTHRAKYGISRVSSHHSHVCREASFLFFPLLPPPPPPFLLLLCATTFVTPPLLTSSFPLIFSPSSLPYLPFLYVTNV